MNLSNPTRGTLAAWLASGALLLTAGCNTTDVIAIDGSSTVYPISLAAAEEFNKVAPGVNVVVGYSGTGGGMKKFYAGEIDLCDASRPISEDEVEACKEAGIEYIELQVAFDGLAVVVHPSNDWCDEVTVEQLNAIWAPESEGKVTSWRDVNPDWPDTPLELYGPGHDSGTYDYFTEVICGEEGSSRQDYSPSENDNALVTGVAGDEGSLGYFGYAYYAENDDKLKVLGVDNGDGPVKPSPETVRDGTYEPLSRPLFLYVRKDALERPEVLQFVEFYIDKAQELAPQVRYVPVPDEVIETNRSLIADAKPAA